MTTSRSRTRSTWRATTLGAVLALALAGCGGGAGGGEGNGSGKARDTLSPAAAVAAAVDQADELTSSRFELASTTVVGGQEIAFGGKGVFDYADKTGKMSFALPGGAGELEQRLLGDTLYLQLPDKPEVFYELALADLVDTSLAGSTDPTSGLQALRGAKDDVVEVGREKVRDADTTHYRGTLDMAKALEVLKGPLRDLLQSTIDTGELEDAPFDAWIDDEGRLRKMEQTMTLESPQLPGQPIEVQTRYELYDFGVEVDVEAPPADQVQDGAPLLEAFKAGTPRA